MNIGNYTNPPLRLFRWAPRAAAALLGAVFLVAAAAKGADPGAFVDQVESFEITTGPAARAVAYGLIPLEAVLGAGLLLGLSRRAFGLAGGLLLAFFIGVTAYGWSQGKTEGCGCFGSLAPRGPGEVIVEDVLLMLLAGLAILPASTPTASAHTRSRARLLGPALLLACGAAAIVFELVSPALPLDDYVTALRPGRKAADLGLGLEGSKPRLVALIDLKSDRIQDTVASLNAIASQPGAARPIAFAAASEQERGQFFWTFGPLFELQEAPAASLRPLYRKLPRVFFLDGGRVVRTWNDHVPTGAELAHLLSSTENLASPATGEPGQRGSTE